MPFLVTLFGFKDVNRFTRKISWVFIDNNSNVHSSLKVRVIVTDISLVFTLICGSFYSYSNLKPREIDNVHPRYTWTLKSNFLLETWLTSYQLGDFFTFNNSRSK